MYARVATDDEVTVPGAICRAGSLYSLLEFLECRLGVLTEDLSGGRKRGRASLSLKERKAQHPLERSDVGADARLREVEPILSPLRTRRAPRLQ